MADRGNTGQVEPTCRRGLPGGVALKLGLWFGLSMLVVVPRLGVRTARVLLIALPVAVVAAGAVAIFKPLSG